MTNAVMTTVCLTCRFRTGGTEFGCMSCRSADVKHEWMENYFGSPEDKPPARMIIQRQPPLEQPSQNRQPMKQLDELAAVKVHPFPRLRPEPPLLRDVYEQTHGKYHFRLTRGFALMRGMGS